jgi:nucleoid DNA-binding protein
MNKLELIDVVSTKTYTNARDIERIINALITTIYDTVRKGEIVRIAGFGKFRFGNRKARLGHNPRTHKPMTIPAHKTPKFVAGEAFKDVVNRPVQN